MNKGAMSPRRSRRWRPARATELTHSVGKLHGKLNPVPADMQPGLRRLELYAWNHARLSPALAREDIAPKQPVPMNNLYYLQPGAVDKPALPIQVAEENDYRVALQLEHVGRHARRVLRVEKVGGYLDETSIIQVDDVSAV